MFNHKSQVSLLYIEPSYMFQAGHLPYAAHWESVTIIGSSRWICECESNQGIYVDCCDWGVNNE